jgi:hypothetical protein
MGVSFIHRTPSIDAGAIAHPSRLARENERGSRNCQMRDNEYAIAAGVGVDERSRKPNDLLALCQRTRDTSVDLISRRLGAGKIEYRWSFVDRARRSKRSIQASIGGHECARRECSVGAESGGLPSWSDLIACGQLTGHRSLSYGSSK